MHYFFPRNLKKLYPLASRAKGVWVYDLDGKSYLDGCSGALCVNIGHSIEEVKSAIAAQFDSVDFTHTSQFVSKPALELAEKIIAMAPPNFRDGGRVYFTSGGSEAVETAIKMARAYFIELGEPGRSVCISRSHSYHGSTLGALSMTGHMDRRKPYMPLIKEKPYIKPPHPYRCECGIAPGSCISELCALNCADDLERAIQEIGAQFVLGFIAEPIVGAALGAAAPHEKYWPRIAEICSRHGGLLIADEVMTGLGRAGANFAVDLWGIQPDIIVLGKGLAAGYMPLGAVVASTKVVSAFTGGSGVFEHGFTYSGHPPSCAAGSAVLDYLAAHDLINSVAGRQEEFFTRLRELYRYEIVGDVRGRGFMAGIELVANRATKKPFPGEKRVNQLMASQAMENGLLVYPGSALIDEDRADHVLIAPPFTITDNEMDELFARLKLTIESVMNLLSGLVPGR